MERSEGIQIVWEVVNRIGNNDILKWINHCFYITIPTVNSFLPTCQNDSIRKYSKPSESSKKQSVKLYRNCIENLNINGMSEIRPTARKLIPKTRMHTDTVMIPK